MRRRAALAAGLCLALSASCAYFNTFYNARRSYREAADMAREFPENPTSAEQTLLEEAITGAAKVLTVYPDSRWVDEAQLLLGDALLLKGRRTLTGSGTSDFREAMMAYASAAVMTEDAVIRDRANLGMGLAAMELSRYNDAVASLESVTRSDRRVYYRSRLYLIEALLAAGRTESALVLADTLEEPGQDSLEAELLLLRGSALLSAGMPDSAATLALSAGEVFGRGSGHYRALTTAAEAFIEAGRPERAVTVLQRLLSGYRSERETAAIALLTGKARLLSADTTGALSSYLSASELDPYGEHGTEAQYRRALLLERRGRLQDAISELSELAGRGGDYLWIRLAADRLVDLQLLADYEEELERAGGDEEARWRLLVAEKRTDLYGSTDAEALETLEELAGDAPAPERATAMVLIAEMDPLRIPAGRRDSLLLEARALADSGDLATAIEESLDLPRGPGWEHRPEQVLESAWALIESGEHAEAWEVLERTLSSDWSMSARPELLWAAYVAASGALMEDELMEGYLQELSSEYPETDLGREALDRLGGSGEGGEEE